MQFKTEKNITRFTLVFLRTVNEISIFLGKICTLFYAIIFLTVGRFSLSQNSKNLSESNPLSLKHLQKLVKKSADFQNSASWEMNLSAKWTKQNFWKRLLLSSCIHCYECFIFAWVIHNEYQLIAWACWFVDFVPFFSHTFFSLPNQWNQLKIHGFYFAADRHDSCAGMDTEARVPSVSLSVGCC